MDTRSLGNAGEDAAVRFLEGLGWTIIGRNIHLRFGEVDILADDGKFLIVVEVKMKRSTLQGLAVEMVTPSKQRTLVKLAKWLQSAYNKPVRIDVITLDNFASTVPRLTHYPFAVGE